MKFLNFLIATGRRFLELSLSSLIMSSLVTAFNLMSFLNTKPVVTIAITLAWIIFLVFNYLMMRDCYFYLNSSISFFAANLIAYGLFAYFSLLLYRASNVAFAWFFGIAKMLQYSPLQLSTFNSLFFFHIIGGISIFVAPIGMKQLMQRMEADMLEAEANIMPIPAKEDEEGEEEQTEE